MQTGKVLHATLIASHPYGTQSVARDTRTVGVNFTNQMMLWHVPGTGWNILL